MMIKRYLFIVIMLMAALLLSGCFVKSLQPTYLDASIIHDFDAYLSFQQIPNYGPPTGGAMWKKNGTVVSTTINSKESDHLKAVFFKVGKNTYLDLTPESSQSEDPSLFHQVPAHCLYKVIVKGDLLHVIPLRTSSLASALKSKNVTLSHELQKDGNNEDLIVTATSLEWNRFLEINGDKGGLFDDEDPLRFKIGKDIQAPEQKGATKP